MPIGLLKELDVNIQSQTSNLFKYFLMQEQKTDITLTSIITEGEEVINVSPGHGFTGVAGEYIVIRYGDLYTQLKVTGVATNAISVELPIAADFPIDAGVMRGNINMNVDGSGTPVDFEFTSNINGGVNAVVPIDLTTVIITMQHGSNVPDDGKFGGLAALAKGLYFRKLNGDAVNLGNYIKNQDFKDNGALVGYTDKAPAGTNATNVMFDIESVFGQVVRLDPRTLDKVLAKIRDNISSGAGMAKLTISLIGSFTSGE